VETGSVGLCWYVVVREKVEVAYVLLHGLELLGSVLVVVSFGCLRWHYAFAVKTHS
jgi:hypothetical protein